MHSRIEPFLALLCRIALRIFFRRVEVQGTCEIPLDRPLLVVSNHGNGLVDPMILFGFLPRTPRFLAKSTLWQHPFARYVVRLGRAIPVYRRQDQSDMTKNEDTFGRCYELLNEGGTIAIFPEGISHAEPHLAELRTGAARIVLGAHQRFGALGTVVVPVGLTFDERHMFRSSLLIQVGEALDPVEITAKETEPTRKVQLLTARIEEALRDVTLNYDSWAEAELIELATEVFVNSATPSQAKTRVNASSALGHRLPIRKQLLASYRQLQTIAPDQLKKAVLSTRTYRRLLRLTGLRDQQVGTRYGLRVVLGFTWRTLRLLFWTLPLALLGLLINYPPYLVPRAIVGVMKLPNDQQATYKVLISVVLFPLVWLGVGFFCAQRWGVLAGMGGLVLAPVSGFLALVFSERARSFKEEARAYWLQTTSKRLSTTIQMQRQEVACHIEGLVAHLEDQPQKE